MKRTTVRGLAAVVLCAFLAQDAAWAAFELRPSEIPFLTSPAVRLELPRSVALVSESYKGRNPETLYLVQDAHTNDSAQLNIARSIEKIVKDEAVKFVFLEGAFTNNSLAALRTAASPEKRRQVAMKYLRQGALTGSEYLDITSDADFIPWGVEDWDLYWKSVKTYEKVAKGREKIQTYLTEIERALETLKPRIFGPSLLEFDKKRQDFLKNRTPLTEHIETLMRTMNVRNMALTHYPHLAALSNLKQTEKAIDFEKANEEQARAVSLLSPEDQEMLAGAAQGRSGRSPFKFSAEDHRTQKGFYALLEEVIGRNAGAKQGYPELSKYFVYLKEAESLDPKAVLEEQKRLENEIYAAMSKTEDERELHQADEALRFLKTLFNLTITPDDFRAYKKNRDAHAIRSLTGFLNRKIMDLDEYHERVTFLREDYAEYLKSAEDFYRQTLDRDMAFLENMLSILSRTGQTKGILVAGGYHTPNLSALLRDKGISFVVVTPQVLNETNHKKYEAGLLGQDEKDIVGAEGAGILTQTIPPVVGGARLSVANRLGAELGQPDPISRRAALGTLISLGLSAAAACGVPTGPVEKVLSVSTPNFDVTVNGNIILARDKNTSVLYDFSSNNPFPKAGQVTKKQPDLWIDALKGLIAELEAQPGAGRNASLVRSLKGTLDLRYVHRAVLNDFEATYSRYGDLYEIHASDPLFIQPQFIQYFDPARKVLFVKRGPGSIFLEVSAAQNPARYSSGIMLGLGGVLTGLASPLSAGELKDLSELRDIYFKDVDLEFTFPAISKVTWKGPKIEATEPGGYFGGRTLDISSQRSPDKYKQPARWIFAISYLAHAIDGAPDRTDPDRQDDYTTLRDFLARLLATRFYYVGYKMIIAEFGDPQQEPVISAGFSTPFGLSGYYWVPGKVIQASVPFAKQPEAVVKSEDPENYFKSLRYLLEFLRRSDQIEVVSRLIKTAEAELPPAIRTSPARLEVPEGLGTPGEARVSAESVRDEFLRGLREAAVSGARLALDELKTLIKIKKGWTAYPDTQVKSFQVLNDGPVFGQIQTAEEAKAVLNQLGVDTGSDTLTLPQLLSQVLLAVNGFAPAPAASPAQLPETLNAWRKTLARILADQNTERTWNRAVSAYYGVLPSADPAKDAKHPMTDVIRKAVTEASYQRELRATLRAMAIPGYLVDEFTALAGAAQDDPAYFRGKLAAAMSAKTPVTVTYRSTQRFPRANGRSSAAMAVIDSASGSVVALNDKEVSIWIRGDEYKRVALVTIEAVHPAAEGQPAVTSLQAGARLAAFELDRDNLAYARAYSGTDEDARQLEEDFGLSRSRLSTITERLSPGTRILEGTVVRPKGSGDPFLILHYGLNYQAEWLGVIDLTNGRVLLQGVDFRTTFGANARVSGDVLTVTGVRSSLGAPAAFETYRFISTNSPESPRALIRQTSGARMTSIGGWMKGLESVLDPVRRTSAEKITAILRRFPQLKPSQLDLEALTLARAREGNSRETFAAIDEAILQVQVNSTGPAETAGSRLTEINTPALSVSNGVYQLDPKAFAGLFGADGSETEAVYYERESVLILTRPTGRGGVTETAYPLSRAQEKMISVLGRHHDSKGIFMGRGLSSVSTPGTIQEASIQDGLFKATFRAAGSDGARLPLKALALDSRMKGGAAEFQVAIDLHDPSREDAGSYQVQVWVPVSVFNQGGGAIIDHAVDSGQLTPEARKFHHPIVPVYSFDASSGRPGARLSIDARTFGRQTHAGVTAVSLDAQAVTRALSGTFADFQAAHLLLVEGRPVGLLLGLGSRRLAAFLGERNIRENGTALQSYLLARGITLGGEKGFSSIGFPGVLLEAALSETTATLSVRLAGERSTGIYVPPAETEKPMLSEGARLASAEELRDLNETVGWILDAVNRSGRKNSLDPVNYAAQVLPDILYGQRGEFMAFVRVTKVMDALKDASRPGLDREVLLPGSILYSKGQGFLLIGTDLVNRTGFAIRPGADGKMDSLSLPLDEMARLNVIDAMHLVELAYPQGARLAALTDILEVADALDAMARKEREAKDGDFIWAPLADGVRRMGEVLRNGAPASTHFLVAVIYAEGIQTNGEAALAEKLSQAMRRLVSSTGARMALSIAQTRATVLRAVNGFSPQPSSEYRPAQQSSLWLMTIMKIVSADPGEISLKRAVEAYLSTIDAYPGLPTAEEVLADLRGAPQARNIRNSLMRQGIPFHVARDLALIARRSDRSALRQSLLAGARLAERLRVSDRFGLVMSVDPASRIEGGEPVNEAMLRSYVKSLTEKRPSRAPTTLEAAVLFIEVAKQLGLEYNIDQVKNALEEFALKLWEARGSQATGHPFAVRLSPQLDAVLQMKESGDGIELSVLGAEPSLLIKVENARVKLGALKAEQPASLEAFTPGDIVSAVTVSLMNAEAMITRSSSVEKLAILPVSGLGHFSDEAEFRAQALTMAAQAVSAQRLIRNKKMGRVEFQFSGLDALADWQRAVITDLGTKAGFLTEEQAASFRGMELELVDSGADSFARGAKRLYVPVGKIRSGELAGWGRAILLAFGIGALYDGGFRPETQTLDYDQVDATKFSEAMAAFYREHMDRPDTEFDRAVWLDVLEGRATMELMRAWAIRLPILERIALDILLQGARLTVRTTGIAA